MKVYFQLIKMNFMSGLQYKGWPFMVIQVLVVVVTDPLGLLLMFSRFGSIGEWTAERILLIYAMAVTSFGLAETFFRGFDYFPWRMVRSGDFDRVLLRPCSTIAAVAGSYFHIHRISRVFGGLCIILWCLSRNGVKLNFLNVITILWGLAGGFLAYAGVFVLTSGRFGILPFFTHNLACWS